MSCEGCSGAVKRILSKNGFECEIDMEKQIVAVKTQDTNAKKIFELIKNSGKEVSLL